MNWEGVDVRLQAAEPPAGSLRAQAARSNEPGLPPLPAGPALYLVRLDGAVAYAHALAARVDGRLEALPREEDHPGFTDHFAASLLRPGSELVLFADGARVGTFVAGGDVSSDTSFCAPRPRIGGMVELIPGADEPGFYLAVPAGEVVDVPRGFWAPPESTAEIRTASLNLAGELMNEFRSPWPQGQVATIRRDLTLIAPLGGVEAAPGDSVVAFRPPFATTYVNEDLLRVGSAPRNAWSLFFLARHNGSRYEPTLVQYRLFERDGKASPHVVAWADVTGDGLEEMVLEVLGEEERWLALAGFQDGEWQLILEDACGAATAGG